MNGLKIYLSDLITPYQSAFVACRMIKDNIMVAHEAFHYLQTQQCKKKAKCGLKINMQKTYDHVEFEFLIKLLERRGFHTQWIKACIYSIFYRILVNGKKLNVIRPS